MNNVNASQQVDTERLDWLEANPCWVQFGAPRWYITKCNPTMDRIGVGDSVRQAIDAARDVDFTEQPVQSLVECMQEALEEVCRVLSSGCPAIVDTVWVSSGEPETLLDHCRKALLGQPDSLGSAARADECHCEQPVPFHFLGGGL